MKILLTVAIVKYALIAVVIVLGWLGIKIGLNRYVYAAANAIDVDKVIGRLWKASWITGWRGQHSAVPRHRPITRRKRRGKNV